jgi:hypothetical protein
MYTKLSEESGGSLE